MNILLLLILCLLLFTVASLLLLRQMDHYADRREIARLLATQPARTPRFSTSMVTALPLPARRFFTYTFNEGAPLYGVSVIDMSGKFSMGNKQAPDYIPIKASQVLAAPRGFVWKMSGGSGLRSLSGSDSGAWTRFWLAGLIPVARYGGNRDHARAAYGRYVAESAFWTPAALLSDKVSWYAVDNNTARFTMKARELSQTVELTVNDIGQPIKVVFQRWSNANARQKYQLQPFGGFLSEFAEFQGMRIPTHIEAGNDFGTSDYYPSFIVDVKAVRFPHSS